MGVIEELHAIVGDSGLVRDDDARFVTDWAGRYVGAKPAAVVRPATTEEVAAVVRVCAAHDLCIVPQGGNTGLVGGSIPLNEGSGDRATVLLSLARCNQIRGLDVAGATITVEAGVTVQAVQEHAAKQGLLFGPDWGARGTAQIGGGISTNAGGLNVLRWGSMRSQILGLEVVLPDGRIWDGLRSLRKDATGFDSKQLFIGTEGTLGIVTAAVFSLHPLPASHQTALLALPNIDVLLELFSFVREKSSGAVSAFELLPEEGIVRVLRNSPQAQHPMAAEPSEWYVVLRMSGEDDVSDLLADVLGQAAEAELITDAVVAATPEQDANLWFIRDEVPPVFTFDERGKRHKFDIAVPVERVVDFIQAVEPAMDAVVPGARGFAFGHVGDGNLHFSFYPGDDCDLDLFDTQSGRLEEVVDELTWSMGGTISAEHGVGQAMRQRLAKQKSSVELDLMRAVKNALDPTDLLNPGKVIPDP